MERNDDRPMPHTRLSAANDPFAGARPLGPGQPGARRAGARGVRWASNWTAAALIAGTAATAGYFAHTTHATPAALVATGATGTGTARPAAGPASCHRPVVFAPVVTSGGSGVVVPATRRGACGTSGSGGAGRTVIVYREVGDN